MRRLDTLTADLDLDEGQQTKVADIGEDDAHSTVRAERDARQKQLQALLAAFTEDSFDAKPIMVSKESTAAYHRAHREVVLVSRLLPILRPPQREKLAQSMGNHRPGGAHGRGDADGSLFPH
jgi:Spy/CpxP family protein refolding chaperone